MISESISAAYFINPSKRSVYACVSLCLCQGKFSKNVTPATNVHATIAKLSDAPFCMWYMSYDNLLILLSTRCQRPRHLYDI